MAKMTQDGRPLSITTPFGKDVLLLESVTGKEEVSRLFHYQVEMLSDKADLDATKILGQKATIVLETDKGGKRYLNGLVNFFVQKGQTDSIQKNETLTRYYLELVPDFWLLTRKIQSRIFQQVSVSDILKTVLAELTPSYKLQGTYNPRDYCVQYRESDFAFASRLMEEEGIFYFFQHVDGKHTMVVGDNPQAFVDVPGEKKVAIFRKDGGGKAADQIMDWHQGSVIRSNKITLRDYCFEMPDKNLEVTASTGKGKVLEIYNYPGGYAKRYDGVDPGGKDRAADLQKIFSDGTQTGDVEMQDQTARTYQIQGTGYCRQFVPGHKFTLTQHFAAAANIDYVLLNVDLAAKLTGAYTSGDGEGFKFNIKFRCLPASVIFRPEVLTPKPIIAGPQTARVVGPSGQEIFTDKYGRVKVQFNWDRLGKNDANSSCWVRVGTPWAGQLWGMIHIPRIGHEVIVAFEDGDPDQPIIVGSVYNSKNMPPYKLPDNMTQSGYKSRSTLKGTGDNFNELRYEDKKGSEQIYFHAEKNFDRVVENNDTLKVGSNKAEDGSQTIEIWKNRTETIKEGNETITIEKGNRTETIKKGNETITLETGSRTTSIKKDETLTVEGKRTQTITGDQTMTVKSGNRSTKVSAGTDTLEAATSITLKVGGCSIEITTSGITIKAPTITIQASATATVDGGGSLVLKGGMVAIN